MSQITICYVCIGVLFLLIIVLAIAMWHQRKDSKLRSDISVYSSRDDFLRRLVSSAATTDINSAAFGIINLLISEKDLRLKYVSLLLWLDNRKKMTYLGTNVPKQYGDALLEHINEVQSELCADNKAARLRSTETGTLDYRTAKERGVVLEYYIPLYNGSKLIGALLVESDDTECNDVLELDFFKLIIENLSLVLYNIVLMQRVIQQANTDNLTKLYNRTYMMCYAESLKTMRSNYSVILLDIDFFKRCNDNYGHAVGDIVLKSVSDVLSTSARVNFDGVFRYGGEEFLIILKDAPDYLAMQRAERIRQRIEELDIKYSGNKTLNITVSLGVSIADRTKSLENNISCADKALYYSKEHGRNRVTMYSRNIEELRDEEVTSIKHTITETAAIVPTLQITHDTVVKRI